MVGSDRKGHQLGLLTLFGALSLAAVTIGCLVARANGAPAAEWVRNLATWIVGALLAGGLAARAGGRAMAVFLAVAPLVLAATLVSHGQASVHRWIQLGPLRMNVAEVLLPATVVACAALSSARRAPWLPAVVSLGLLMVQPDASQATALGGALAVIAWSSRDSRLWRFGGVALVVLAVAASWTRPDPLAPVPEVEGIMGLARTLSPAVAVAAWAALAGAVLAPIAMVRSEAETARTAALALAAYGSLSALTPLAGAFPVPLVGMGMSPILGLWLGAGLLAALDRRAP